MDVVVEEQTAFGGTVDERLARIYATELHRLIGLGRLLTGSLAAGEDLAQEVFVRLLRISERDPSYLREPAWPWLRVVMTRLAIQRRRQLARELARLARLSRRPQELSWPESTIDLIAALRTLPPRMRACTALFYGEDLSIAQVAEALHCSERTVENQLRSARSRLARQLQLGDTGARCPK